MSQVLIKLGRVISTVGSIETLDGALRKQSSTTSFDAAILKLGSTELTSSCGLLLQHLLFMSIGITNLNDMLFAARFADRSIVKLSDDIFADITRFKAELVSKRQSLLKRKNIPSKTDTTTVSTIVAKDASRKNLEGMEGLG